MGFWIRQPFHPNHPQVNSWCLVRPAINGLSTGFLSLMSMICSTSWPVLTSSPSWIWRVAIIKSGSGILVLSHLWTLAINQQFEVSWGFAVGISWERLFRFHDLISNSQQIGIHLSTDFFLPFEFTPTLKSLVSRSLRHKPVSASTQTPMWVFYFIYEAIIMKYHSSNLFMYWFF